MSIYPKEFIDDADKPEQLRSCRLLKINEEAALFYGSLLYEENGKEALEYLGRRGLVEKTLKNFRIGYAPEQYDVLYKHLQEKGFGEKELLDSGLIRHSSKYGSYDFFRNRVVFPIMDKNSRVIGFGGRALKDGEPKYLNSPETPVFDKGRSLYGLHTARLTRRPYFILCEGYMDVLSLYQAGFDAALASLGTALTTKHAMQMKPYGKRIIIGYDNDGAGVNAAMRAIPILRKEGLDLRVLDLKPYKDPDEFMACASPDAFEKRLEKALNFFLFQSDVWKRQYDPDDPADVTAFHKRLARELQSFPEPLEQENYLTAVCRRYGISKELLKGEIERMDKYLKRKKE